MVFILGILTKLLAPKVAPNTGKEADAAEARAAAVADEAKRQLDEAKRRETDPGIIGASTTAPVTVGPAPINTTSVNVDKVGPTHAPEMPVVAPMGAAQVVAPQSVAGIGSRIAGNGAADTVEAQQQQMQVNRQGQGYQSEAATALSNILHGKGPSVAEEQLKASRDRAAAEQLSQAAGARGQNVASARRNASINTSLADVEFGGQFAQLRAKEIADAAAGLTSVGGTMAGQALQEATTKATLDQQVELQNVQAKDAAIQASKERFAKGEITQAQLDTEIAKANADYQQRTGEKNIDVDAQVKMQHATQQLTADLATDDRLQKSFDLQAQLQVEVAKGNQNAAVELQALQARLSVEVGEFNARMIQSATGQNIENRLRALQMDDQFVTNMSAQWLNAEATHDDVALRAIKLKIEQAIGQASANEAWKKSTMDQLAMINSLASGVVAPGGAIDMIKGGMQTNAVNTAADHFDEGGTGITSDLSLKTDIKGLKGADIDGFLRSNAVRKSQTWRYKNADDAAKHGSGTKLGPMAQDVQRDKLGSAAVGQRADGKLTLDYQHLAALALAGLGRLNERVEAVERKSGPDVKGFLRSTKKMKARR